MVLSKSIDNEKQYICELCNKTINDLEVAVSCCLCEFKAHKKCNKSRSMNYISISSKNKFPMCINCRENTLPFQKPDKEINTKINANNDVRKFFETINNDNLKNIIDKNDDETAPIDCKYVDYDSFDHIEDEKKLSLFHMNIASLAKNKEELETSLQILNFKFDIIALTETKILKGIDANFDIAIDGYRCYQTPTEASKGGSILYIKNKFNTIPRDDLNKIMYKSKQIESSFIEIINSNKKNIVIGCIYRHPSMDLNEFNECYLGNLLDKISMENKNSFLLGDFNADLMNLETNKPISNYFDILASHLYIPHIIYPTRIVDNEMYNFPSKTLIDNIFSNCLNFADGISGNITLSISDHLAQFLIIPVECKIIKQQFNEYKRDTKNMDKENFTLDMLEVDWKSIIKVENNDPNLSFVEFEKKLNSIIDHYMPLRKLTKKEMKQQCKPWITLGIRNSIRRRDTLHKKFIKAKNPDIKNAYHLRYKELRNQIVTLCRISKRNFYQNYFAKNSNNLKNTWKGINNLINLNKNFKTNPSSLIVDDQLITDPNYVANEYNNYFSTIASKLRDKIYDNQHDFMSYLGDRKEKTFVCYPTTKEEVIDIINELDCMKGTGPHSIPTDVLIFIKFMVSESISDIINLSFNTGIYIEKLKISKIIPIYKGKGSNLECCNYRPISLLSNIDKIVEKIMHKRLYCFFTKYKIIYNLQFGFRSGHSTTHALIYLTEQVRKALDSNCFSCGVFVDLQKAFDTVDHEILLHKLSHYGVRGIENNWFKSYLSNRKQYVSINGANSTEVNVHYGVPQGSVLGPLLFLIYINDLNKALKYCTTIHFADDTSLLLKNKSLKKMRKYLNLDLKNLSNWLNANKISLNANKTELLLFRHPNKRINFHLKVRLNGKQLEPAQYVKYLGMYIDPHLNWKYNTNILASKLTRSLGMLSKIRHYVNKDTLRSIYFAIFSSHLSYGSIIWAQNQTNMNVKRISRLQNKAVRIMNFSDYRDHANPIFKQLNIIKLSDNVSLQNILLVYDSLNSRLPSILNHGYNYVLNFHAIRTRNALKLKLALPTVKTTAHGINSIEYKSVKTWNDFIDEFKKLSFQTLPRSKVKNIVTTFFSSRYV